MDFKDQDSLSKAYELNGSELDGYSLVVDETRPKPDNRDGGFSGGRGNYNGGRGRGDRGRGSYSGGRGSYSGGRGGRDGGRGRGRGDRGRGGRGGARYRQSAFTASTGKPLVHRNCKLPRFTVFLPLDLFPQSEYNFQVCWRSFLLWQERRKHSVTRSEQEISYYSEWYPFYVVP
jgi:hypothetical protein